MYIKKYNIYKLSACIIYIVFSMSQGFVKLAPIKVLDPRLQLNDTRAYTVLTGGSTVSWKPVTSTSYSTSNIQYSAPPPNERIVTDRNVEQRWFVEAAFVGTKASAYTNLLDGYGSTLALRQFPIAQSTNVLNVTINNSSVSINSNDVHSALVRCGTDVKERYVSYSTTAAKMDNYPDYKDAFGAVNSPLTSFADNVMEIARGAFPVTIVSNTPTTGTIRTEITEPLFLSPFLFGKNSDEHSGFYGVKTLDFNVTLMGTFGTGNTMFSNDTTNGSTFSSITVTFYAAPQMIFNYITPKETENFSISRPLVLPYYEVERYPTNIGSIGAYGGGSDTATTSSSNIQLNSIPRRMVIFARRRNQDRTFNTTDTFAYLSNLSINWNNQAGLLSSATPQDLYRMASMRGISYSWTEWRQYVGSILIIEFGTDIGLGATEAPGMMGQYQFQFTVTMQNLSASACNFDLYAVPINEGTFTIVDGRAIKNIGNLSERDVLEASEMKGINYKSLQGGNFFDGLKNAFNSVVGTVGSVVPYVKAALPYVQMARSLAGVGMSGGRRRKMHRRGGRLIGGGLTDEEQSSEEIEDYEESKEEHKVPKGGRLLSRSEMKQQLAGGSLTDEEAEEFDGDLAADEEYEEDEIPEEPSYDLRSGGWRSLKKKGY